MLERPSTIKSSTRLCCEPQTVTSVLADVSEADTSCARPASLPGKNSDHKPVVARERHTRAVERLPCVAEVRQPAPTGPWLFGPCDAGDVSYHSTGEWAKPEDVQGTTGHVDPSTTTLYDPRWFMSAKSAAFGTARSSHAHALQDMAVSFPGY
jgi:hypothetical protein